MIILLFGLMVFTMFPGVAIALDTFESQAVSPGCHLGKDGKEICPNSDSRGYDAYDYYPVSFCQISRDGKKLTCPVVRIFPRRPTNLHSLVVDFRRLTEEEKRGIEVGLCVRSHRGGGDDCPPAVKVYQLKGTEALLKGNMTSSIVRDSDWSDYMYIEVKNKKSNALKLENAVIGYRTTWLLDAKK